MDFTKEQEQAIYSKEKKILVSAGAGAGKTRVLVTRISEMILSEDHPLSADEFLVLTFTNAAAREMKERVIKELDQRLYEDPENRRLRQQIRVVKHADISTVHSFCNHLIRTHFNDLELDPSFRIGEEGEMKILRKEAMDQLLEECYVEGKESFLHFVESYAPNRDDKNIETMIENIYNFSRGFADAKGWFRKVDEEFKALMEEDTAEDSKVLRTLFHSARTQISSLQPSLEKLLPICQESEISAKVYDYMLSDQKLVDELLSAASFSEFYEKIHAVSFSSFPAARGKLKDWPYHGQVKAVHENLKKNIEQLSQKHFLKSMAAVRMEQKKLYPLFQEAIRLVEEYERIYFALKKEKNLYDFDDLEHFALQLLVDHYEENGNAVPSAQAKEIAEHYKAIFVDEYQDTNLVQETILSTLLSSSDASLFVVGDVKQSIYRFRQARPDLFMDRYHRYESGEGEKIELRDNFRSSPDVLDFCNMFFKKWMRSDFGGINYDENVSLRAGENGPMHDFHTKQECLLLIKDEEADVWGEGIDQMLAEAVMIGEKIEELKAQGYHYRDIVILLRSVKENGQIIADYLEMKKIPVLCESQLGYFQTREIRVILNYLSVIDNIYQDIPMASVMLSSIGAFTPTDLAKMKIMLDPSMRKDCSLYELMNLYLTEAGDELLKEKIRIFLTDIHEFRRKKQEMLLHELIWEIYQKTGLYDHVLSMPHGEKRRENLMMLLKYAEQYEKTMFKGLFYFIRHMKQLRTYEVEPGGGSVQESVEDAIRIMTIHKSKGLEYPVVFISNLSKKFNFMDVYDKILYHPEIGIGMDTIDLEERVSSPSTMKVAISERIKKETLEEELRILYVAMTRAQKKLILTGVVTQKKLEEAKKGAIPSAVQANCYMDWILPLLCSENMKNCTNYHFHQIAELLKLYNNGNKTISFDDLLGQLNLADLDISQVEKSFSTIYPYEHCISWKRKYSVSELKKLSMQKLPDEEMNAWDEPVNENTDEIPLPEFLSEKQEEISGTAYGTMVHKVMELLPFSQIHDKKDLYSALENIWDNIKDASLPLKKRIYRAAEDFLFSETGQKYVQMDSCHKLQKELPFTIGFDASIIYPGSEGGETIILQGVIDVCAEDEEGLWLLDYKTDRIREGQESVLLDRYKTQMLYYRLALEQMFSKKVVHTMIYSFSLKKFIEISWD